MGKFPPLVLDGKDDGYALDGEDGRAEEEGKSLRGGNPRHRVGVRQGRGEDVVEYDAKTHKLYRWSNRIQHQNTTNL